MTLSRLILTSVCTIPWVVALAAAGHLTPARVSKWAWHTGLAIDDVRGALAHRELIRTLRLRRAGGAVGSAVAGAFLFTGKDTPTMVVAVMGMALAGYGLGVVAAEVTRRPCEAAGRRVVRLEGRDLGAEVGTGSRNWALALVGAGTVFSLAALVWPHGADRWPIAIIVALVPLWVVVLVWCERLPRWGSDEVEADVLAAFRVAGVRVLWAMCLTWGLLAALAGVVTLLGLRNWTVLIVVPEVLAMQVLGRSAGGERVGVDGWMGRVSRGPVASDRAGV